jgi:hypothetical protein
MGGVLSSRSEKLILTGDEEETNHLLLRVPKWW